MSWGRLDDDFWKHPKVKRLIDGGHLEALGAWVVLLSYANNQRRDTLDPWEVAMVLRRSPAEADLAIDPLLLREEVESGVFRAGLLLRKQDGSTVINDFEKYRSKHEAKSAAGAQGGKKSGESRRSKPEAKSKQTRSKVEADPKQSRSPDPDPDPDPQIPIPDPDPPASQISESWKPGSPIRSVADLESAVADRGWAIGTDSRLIARARGVILAGPIEPHEWHGAVEITESKQLAKRGRSDPRPAYAIAVIDGARKDAADEASKERFGPTRAPSTGRGWNEFPTEETG